MPKPSYEVAARRHLGLPRHSTANDDAVMLLRLAALVVVIGALMASTCSWVFARIAAFSSIAFVGFSLQQCEYSALRYL